MPRLQADLGVDKMEAAGNRPFASVGGGPLHPVRNSLLNKRLATFEDDARSANARHVAVTDRALNRLPVIGQRRGASSTHHRPAKVEKGGSG